MSQTGSPTTGQPTSRAKPAAQLFRLVAVLATLAVATSIGVWTVGKSLSFPPDLFASLVIASAPMAVIVAAVDAASATGWRTAAFAALGVGALIGSQRPLLVGAAGLLALVPWTRRTTPAYFRTLALGTLAAVFGYSAVWNANLLVVAAVGDQPLFDATLRDADRLLYSFVGLQAGGSYENLFPLVRHAGVLAMLEQAYLLVIPELFGVLLLCAATPSAMAGFLTRVFAGYAIGFVTFLLVPAVGPCIAFPRALDPTAMPTITMDVATSMAKGYAAAKGVTTERVIAYFVALPSLHVALACLFQWEVRRHRAVRAFLTPINVAASQAPWSWATTTSWTYSGAYS